MAKLGHGDRSGAREAEVPTGEGYRVRGAHDADLEELIQSVLYRARTEMSRQYLELNPHRSGWISRKDEVAGMLIFSEETELAGPTTWWSMAAP